MTWDDSASMGFKFFFEEKSSPTDVAHSARTIDTCIRSAPSRIPVPMPGGWGSLLRGSRCLDGQPGGPSLLCDRYEGAFDPCPRAFVTLGILAWTGNGGRLGNWVPAAFIECAAEWWRQYEVQLGLSPKLNLKSRWVPVLTALRLLANGYPNVDNYYREAVDRCLGSRAPKIAPAGQPAGRAVGMGSVKLVPWSDVATELNDPKLAAPLLARYFLHVLHAELNVEAPDGLKHGGNFYSQLGMWFSGVTADTATHCFGKAGHTQCAISLWQELQGHRLFGGGKPLRQLVNGSGQPYPEEFQPYSMGPKPRLSYLLKRLGGADDHPIVAVHALAVLIVDKLIDPLQVRACNPPPLGFSWVAYNHLEGRYRTTIAGHKASGRPAPLTAQGIRIHRLTKELELSEMRLPKYIRGLLKSVQYEKALPPATPGCAVCGMQDSLYFPCPNSAGSGGRPS